MAVETRLYTPRDAPELAAFLRRNGYGPASQGLATAARLELAASTSAPKRDGSRFAKHRAPT